MKKSEKEGVGVLGNAWNGAVIVGSIAAVVVSGLFNDPTHEFAHQRKQGILSRSWWKGEIV